MEINKIKFKKVNACLLDLSAPFATTIIMCNMLPDISNTCIDWWCASTMVSTEKYRTYISCRENTTKMAPRREIKGFRPIIIFADTVSSTIKKGDTLLIDGFLFEVYAKGRAISKTVIDFCKYDELDAAAKKWKQRLKDVKDIYKVTDSESFTVTDFSFDILTMSDYTNLVNINSPQNNYSYWLKCRDSEFEGYCSYAKYSDKHSVFTADIQSVHVVCPVLKYSTTQVDARESDILEINGFLFKILSSVVGMALSLSPTAYSCYSTGMGNIEDEEEFYKDSEVCACVKKFKHDLKFCK